MRVLYTANVDIGLANGPGVNEREFVVCAARRFGGDFVAVLPTPSAEVPELPRTARRFCFSHRGYRPMRIWRFLLEQLGVCLWLAAVRQLDSAVVRLGPFPVAAWALQRVARVPVAVKTLGRLDAVHKLDGTAPLGWLRRLSARMQLAVLQRAVAIDAVTPELSRRAAALLGDSERMRVVGNAVNTQRFRPCAGAKASAVPGLERWAPVVGYAGGVPSERGAVQLVECLRALADRLPRMAILVVGDDPGLDQVRRLAGEYGVLERCFFTGAVSYSEVPRYVGCMDVCVSFDVPAMAAVRGNASQKVRQYLAMGKPVISTDAGNEFLRDRDLGTLVDPLDHTAIAEHVLAWWRRMQAGHADFERRACVYAREHLSIEVALEQRVAFWRARLEQRA